MDKPSPTQLAALRALASGDTLYWTDTLFKGFAYAKVGTLDVRVPTVRALVHSGWIRRSGGRSPTWEYKITRAGRLAILDRCVKCGSLDVKVCEPDMCGPCYVAASSQDDDE